MCKKHPCTTALFLSVIVGVVLSILYSFCYIAQTAVLLWISFGLALTVLFTVTFILTTLTDERGSAVRRCLCPYGRCILSGVIGTIVSTMAGLAITLLTTGIVSIIIFFLVGAFFTLMITTFFQFIFCVLRKICCE